MSHYLPPTGSTWVISDTANKTITFSKGMLEAATSDNISPVAVLCCESFGSLLPLCVETRYKIEQIARQSHTSHVFNFIKAQVGYKKNDSVEQLSRSDAGIRFLCLAAAFCTLEHYDAASRLDSLLQVTQRDQQLRPTIRQLQIMLDVLKTKLVLSDYGRIVAGYEILFRSLLAELGPQYDFVVAQVPSKSSLQELIIAMNEIGRIGEDNAEIEIKAKAQYAAWTCAFVKWCLGSPPTTRSSSGKHIMEQKDSSVTLTVIPQVATTTQRKRPLNEMESDLEVVPVRRVRGLTEIIFREDPSTKRFAWQGMVNPKMWVHYHAEILHDRFPILRKNQRLLSAVGQSLYFIVKHLPEHLIVCNDFKALASSGNKTEELLGAARSRYSPQAFLSGDIRVRIAKGLLDGHLPLVQQDCDDQKTLVPYNLAQVLAGSCRHCRELKQNKMIQGTMPCQVNELLELLGTIGSALLIFTLFGPVVDTYPMVTCGSEFDSNHFHRRLMPDKKTFAITSESWPKVVTTGWQALMHGHCTVLSCPPISIFKHAAKLMGHQNIWDSTIISSKCGQVLFPAFFESTSFIRSGFMQLSAFQGKLSLDDMQFDFFIDDWSDKLNTESMPDADTEEISTDDEEMESRAVTAEENTPSPPVHDPSQVLPLADMADNLDSEASADTSADDEDTGRQTGEASDIEQGEGQAIDPDSIDEEIEPEATDERIGSAISTTGNHPAAAEEIAGPTAPLSGNSNNIVPPDFVVLPHSKPEWLKCGKWRVSVHDNILRGELQVSNTGQEVIAWNLIECLARCLLTLECGHKSTCKAGELGQQFRLEHSARMIDPRGPKIVLNVGRQYEDQLAALEMQDYFPPTIVHLDGCTRCALQLCIDHNCRTVIC